MKFDRNFLMGILFGLIIASTPIYGYEAYGKVIQSVNIIEGPFFLIAAILYIPVGYWAIKHNSNLAYYILLIGTIGIFIAYALSRSDLYYLVGREKIGTFGSLGIMSKIYQAGIIIISIWAIYSKSNKKEIKMIDK
jgi:hypothetical protein